MDKKLGVYICKGCGIGDCLNTDKLVEIATNELQTPIVRTSPAFCLEDVQLIKDDIEKEGVNSVVIAACSGRVNTDVFSLRPAIVERVNIREQVVWSHVPNNEETQSLADDYLRMGIIKGQKTEPPTPYTEANERTVLVVGGGIAGLTAALDAAKAGFKAVLVEKASRLGGFAVKMKRQCPKHPPYTDLEDTGIEARIREVEGHPNITTYVSAQIEKISGQPGSFEVTLRQDGTVKVAKVGAIVLATGWKPYDATQFENYGFGKFQNVITSVMLEEMASEGKISRPSDGRDVKNVAIVQCEGSADEKHYPYSGNVTSLVLLKQAVYLREHYPNSSVYLFYQDMNTPGQYEYFYKRVQKDEGVFFSQGEVKGVIEDEEKNIVLEVENTLLGGTIRIKADMLILSIGMVPAILDSDGLNLEYLQGKELPTTRYGFADSHFICFPYETRRTGIYSAGCVRQPMDLAASARDGTAAALKAIQCIESSSAGAAVHPRVGDLSYPSFFMQNCTSCGRCTQECPFGALEVDAKGHPILDTNRCRRCGICMGSCPVQIISFDDYSVDMLSSMIKAVEIPEDDEAKPRILAFACENDAYPALDMAGINRLNYPASVRVIPVRCLGSVNSILITDALSRGFDGVAMMGCKAGEDYQCHYIQGSELSAKRMENVQETLNRLALEPERINFMEVEISDSDKIPLMLSDFVDRIKKVGLNPFKGF
ncbi:MAG: FAD-dependent oxidoreductase [Deltaproteobacteria bacterium]|nr:FAD-dependent oxidoreductase [Deltaproteobacteria bacterium]